VVVRERKDDSFVQSSNCPLIGNAARFLKAMNIAWIYKDGEVIQLPSLTAVIQRDRGWFVSTCPEPGVASQGKTRKEAYAMLAEAVELWLEAASAKEVKRRLKLGGSVQPLQLAHA